jgi:hypothetical protein
MNESKTNLFVVISKFKDNYMYLPEIYLLQDSKFPPKTIYAFLGGLLLNCSIFQRIENHSIKAMKGESKIDTFLQQMHPPNIPARSDIIQNGQSSCTLHSFKQKLWSYFIHLMSKNMSTQRERERERERECLIKSGLQLLSDHGSKERTIKVVNHSDCIVCSWLENHLKKTSVFIYLEIIL